MSNHSDFFFHLEGLYHEAAGLLTDAIKEDPMSIDARVSNASATLP